MKRYGTPDIVASALAKYVSTKAKSILDPAVGEGALLSPIIPYVRKNINKIVCVDIDKEAVSKLNPCLNEFSKTHVFHSIHGDFLKLVNAKRKLFSKESFDCIVMNPPFSAKKEKWVKVSVPGNKKYRKLPIEAAFILNAVQLLKPHGRLLAILPPSIIAMASTSWLREYMLSNGSILYVHELPSFSFVGVESRVYLFVYKKTVKKNNILLLNHDLNEPEKMTLSKKKLGGKFRLDFSYQSARAVKNKIIDISNGMEWQPLKLLADIYRGTEESPYGSDYAIHTSDYKDGFWYVSDRHEVLNDSSIKVRRGDLLIKRVGRECCLSLSKVVGIRPVACTDCVLIIRPKTGVLVNDLLLKLRVVLTADWGKKMIEKGTGANYITKNELLELNVPGKLNKRYKRTAEKYCKAATAKNLGDMIRYERYIQSQLIKKVKSL